ncbi:hypothetical protein [Deinococcus sp. UYEF24]
MKMRYLPAPDIDVKLLEETVALLLSGFVAAPGQRLISNDELVKMASRSLDEVHIELIRRSRIQVQLDG